jgi:hypothetical protein
MPLPSCGSAGNFEDPFLEPLTHSYENVLLAFKLYEIEISVAASMPAD